MGNRLESGSFAIELALEVRFNVLAKAPDRTNQLSFLARLVLHAPLGSSLRRYLRPQVLDCLQ